MLRHRVSKLVVPASLAAGVALSTFTHFVPAATAATPPEPPLSFATPSEPAVVAATPPAPAVVATAYTVLAGDTLELIAPKLGTTWPTLASYNHLADPDLILVSEVLQAPPAGYVAPAAVTVASAGAQSTDQASTSSSASTVSTDGSSSSSIAACILARENGGSYGRSDNPSHFGAYQFDRSTWASNGGNPADWGSASADEQNQVFANTVAASGYSSWTPYDGC